MKCLKVARDHCGVGRSEGGAPLVQKAMWQENVAAMCLLQFPLDKLEGSAIPDSGAWNRELGCKMQADTP